MQLLKNLWNRRRANAWLFIELVIVTVLSWIMIDLLAVSIHDTSIPMGIDTDRLVYLEIRSKPDTADGYSAEADSTEANHAAVRAIMDKVRGFEGVASATICDVYALPGGQSCYLDGICTGNPAVDTVINLVYMARYIPGEHYFETFGIEAVPGSPSAAELSRLNGNDIILTEDMAELLWPGENAVGRRVVEHIDRETGDTTWQKVAGVVGGVRWVSMLRSRCLKIECDTRFFNWPVDSFACVIRLGDGTDADAFMERLDKFARRELSIGNFYAAVPTPYSSIIEKTETDYGITDERRQQSSLAIFFFANLILGTVGCFWLQTLKRTHETGIRRAFGARRTDIIRMFTAESVTLASAAFIIGDLLYLWWAADNGLSNGFGNNGGVNVVDDWVSSFPLHFAIVSAIVYVIIIVCVVVGTIFPAIKASRVSITDALHDE